MCFGFYVSYGYMKTILKDLIETTLDFIIKLVNTSSRCLDLLIYFYDAASCYEIVCRSFISY